MRMQTMPTLAEASPVRPSRPRVLVAAALYLLIIPAGERAQARTEAPQRRSDRASSRKEYVTL